MNALFLVNAIIFLVVGIYCLLSKKNTLTVIFFATNIGLCLWNIFIFLIEVFPTKIPVNLISQCQLLSALIYGNGFYYFGQAYLKKKKIQVNLNIIIFFTFFIFIFFTDLVTKAVLENNKVMFQDGIGYTFYSLYLLFLGLSTIVFLTKSWFTFPNERKRTIYLILGMGSFSLLAIFFDLILPVMGIYKYLTLGYVSTIIPSIAFAYAITKVDLLEIKVVIGKMAAWLFTFSLFLGIAHLIINPIFKIYPSIYTVWISIIIVISAYSGSRVQKLFITTAKRKFLKGYYDRPTILTTITEKIATLTSRRKIFETIEYELDKAMEFEKTHVIISERKKDQSLSHYLLLDKDSMKEEKIDPESELMQSLASSQTMIFADTTSTITQAYLSKRGYTNLNRTLLIPLYSPEWLEGIIILGERGIQVDISQSDKDFLTRLAIIIEALLYRLTPFEKLEKHYQQLHEADIMRIQSEKNRDFAFTLKEYNHEIRTPLVGIHATAEDLPEDTDQQRTDKKDILENTKRAKDILESILRLTADSVKKAKQNKNPQKINAIIEDSIRHMKTRKSIDIVRVLNEEELIILGIRDDLERIIMNIIQNSVEAMPDGGKLKFKTKKSEKEVIIEISDTGMGIPKESLTKVFEMHRSRHITKGRGLGLTIVHKLVQEHGGRITVDSQEEKGTTVRLSFPEFTI